VENLDLHFGGVRIVCILDEFDQADRLTLIRCSPRIETSLALGRNAASYRGGCASPIAPSVRCLTAVLAV
jgi:hypothetical protein